jgi:hypothetical protein
MAMEVCDFGKEAERVADRVSGAQNLYGQETSIKRPQYFRPWRDKEQSEKEMHSMANFGSRAHVFWKVNP